MPDKKGIQYYPLSPVFDKFYSLEIKLIQRVQVTETFVTLLDPTGA